MDLGCGVYILDCGCKSLDFGCQILEIRSWILDSGIWMLLECCHLCAFPCDVSQLWGAVGGWVGINSRCKEEGPDFMMLLLLLIMLIIQERLSFEETCC